MSDTLGQWHKSSYCGNEGECVEVALGAGQVGVRDSADPAGPQLLVPAAEWRAFVVDVASGRLAYPHAVGPR